MTAHTETKRGQDEWGNAPAHREPLGDTVKPMVGQEVNHGKD